MKKLLMILLSSCLLMSASKSEVDFMHKYGCTFWKEMTKYYAEDISDIIITQALHETGHGKASWVESKKQLTAVYGRDKKKKEDPTIKLLHFDSWEEYYKYKSTFYKKRGYNTSSPEKMLKSLHRYAEDPLYVVKISKLLNKVTELRRTICSETL